VLSFPTPKKKKENIWWGLGSQVVVFQICEPNTRKVKRTHLVGGGDGGLLSFSCL
jgi:hypothetical protein